LRASNESVHKAVNTTPNKYRNTISCIGRCGCMHRLPLTSTRSNRQNSPAPNTHAHLLVPLAPSLLPLPICCGQLRRHGRPRHSHARRSKSPRTSRTLSRCGLCCAVRVVSRIHTWRVHHCSCHAVNSHSSLSLRYSIAFIVQYELIYMLFVPCMGPRASMRCMSVDQLGACLLSARCMSVVDQLGACLLLISSVHVRCWHLFGACLLSARCMSAVDTSSVHVCC
jgi:hypothetical protein